MSTEALLNRRKEERLDVRLRKDAKQLISDAAALTHQSVSDFVVSVALERSREVIERSATFTLSRQEASRFLDALAKPPRPNAKLRNAAQRYQRALEDGTLETA